MSGLFNNINNFYLHKISKGEKCIVKYMKRCGSNRSNPDTDDNGVTLFRRRTLENLFILQKVSTRVDLIYSFLSIIHNFNLHFLFSIF